ncbi:MAG: alpha/beta hydrolase [Rikenellaceae bacterium]|nr:alpha/beta hydrolase [Rikenellaceae bacterium]
MKKYILLTVALLLSLSGFALGRKQTYLYAVKGADSLYLDHYVSSGEAMRPCMIFVFGGGFVRGERDNEGYLPYFEYLNDNGYDVVSIDYRLGLKDLSASAAGSMRDMIGKLNNAVNIAVEDLFSATAFVLDNAREWGIDRDMIVTCGSSAGAITVLQAEHALCNRKREATLLPEGFRYAGVVSFAGAIFSLDGAPKWREKPAPVLLFHGSADRQVPYDKATMLGVGFFGSKYLAEMFEDEGWPYWFYDVEYQTHAMAGLPMVRNLDEISTFLKYYVREKRPLRNHTRLIDGDEPERETKFKVKDYIEANYAR